MKIKVGVLRGGAGPEYDVSLKTGGAVLANLDREKYRPVDILIDKDGVWHADGVPLRSREELKSIVNIIWNGMHGYFGEDGRVQNILEGMGLPFTGPSSLRAYASFNKTLAKEKFSKLGLRAPFGQTVGDAIEAREIFQKISPPWIVKPLTGTCSIDVYLAKNFDELVWSLAKVLENHESALVEEFVRGREINIGIIGNTLMMPPADLTLDERVLLQEAAAKVHETFELGHYSLVDLILSKSGVYVLEVDSLPDLGEQSLFRRSLSHAGTSMPEFLDCVINKTLGK